MSSSLLTCSGSSPTGVSQSEPPQSQKEIALGTNPREKKIDLWRFWLLVYSALQLAMRPHLFAAHQRLLCFPALLQLVQISLIEMLWREIAPIAAVAFVGLLAPLALAVFATQGPVVMQVVA